MKATNRTYYNIGNSSEPPYVTWDITDDDGNIVIPDLTTTGEIGDSKSQLQYLTQKVVDEYEETL